MDTSPIVKERENILSRKIEDITIDEANLELLKVAKELGIETVFDRLAKQQPRCIYCYLGVSCRICAMGPCKITNKADKGVCGANADVMVARNLLRNILGGTSSHVDHARHVAMVLLEAAEGLAPYKIKDVEKLKRIAEKLGIHADDTNELAKKVALLALEDIGRSIDNGTMAWIKLHAPEERIETWKKLGVLPSGASVTVVEGMHRTSMGNDADPVNLVLGAVKASIVDGYAGLSMSTDLQDILFGTPKPKFSEAGMGVLEEDYVNIACHGHVPILSEKIVEAAEELEEEAKKAGAKGINVVGICCTGNEILERQGIRVVGNELNSELVIATGALDAIVVDYQCIYPSLAEIAKCFHTKLITTSPIVKIPGAEHIELDTKKADEIARKIVRKAIESFKMRDKSKIKIPKFKAKVLAGFSVESLLEVLEKISPEDPLKPVIDAVKSGDIRGFAAIVGCNNPKVKHDYMHVEIAKLLVKNDVLVIATGCAAHAHAKAGLMVPEGYKLAGDGLRKVLKALGSAAGLEALPPVLHFGSCVDNSRIGDLLGAIADRLGVSIKDLPVVASAPEYTTEKAMAIGTWAVALGVPTHVNPVPRILGSELVTKLLTEEAEKILGGFFFIGETPEETVEKMLKIIDERRKKLFS